MYILICNKVLQLSVHFLLGYFNKLELRVGRNGNIALCASCARRRGLPLQTEFEPFSCDEKMWVAISEEDADAWDFRKQLLEIRNKWSCLITVTNTSSLGVRSHTLLKAEALCTRLLCDLSCALTLILIVFRTASSLFSIQMISYFTPPQQLFPFFRAAVTQISSQWLARSVLESEVARTREHWGRSPEMAPEVSEI